MASNLAEADSIPRRLRAKPPPLDLHVVSPGVASIPNRIQFWPAAQQRVAPELGLSGPGSPTAIQEGGLSPGIALSPLSGEGPLEGGWAGLPAHILELILAALRDSKGRWPSRKVLFSVCGVCKLWRRVGYTLFFSSVWLNHTDVIVHPSQLFTLSPLPLRLHTSDHLLRCFVHRTPSTLSGLSPRFGRLWRFALYLGSDHRGLRCGFRIGQSSGGPNGGLGMAGGGLSANPQLLMLAQQTGRRSYQLLLSPATGPGSGPGGQGGARTTISWRSPRPGNSLSGLRPSEGGGHSGWRSPQSHISGDGNADRRAAGISGNDRGGGSRGDKDSGVVAVLRSNIRCSHYELIPKSSCPWARRLIAVAGYMPLQGGPAQPLIELEYRLRVRGIMLPRRMKVQVPVPHSLQRVVHNPLYDLHEPMADASPSASRWPPIFGANGEGGVAAAMAPPAPGAAGAVGAAAQPGAPNGGGGFLGEGQEGLMDNLEDILEAAMRTEPLLFADMMDAAVVRPADDDETVAGGDFGGRGGGGRVPSAAGAAAAGRALRRTGSTPGSLGSALLRGLLLNRHPAGGSGGGVNVQQAGGSVQWWDPGSPGGSRGVGDAGGAADDASKDNGAMGGWAAAPPPPTPTVQLQNKAPHWNDALMCWCLNFRGRVKMASVKNFQLMCSADKAERCVMQFGKVEEGFYILDFNPCVLTAAQAFAAALSTFETKYLL
ncbi:hypothetical protein VaNZ11_001240 [Volvox africanus]|uniref:Tubby C-terminal domain-containing protein n=1 Tax=Volvox africanus TaxID=51714 RepID=A0ABQ5RPC0_9CHLO|nr:hypothetical protein VaNZ11_001240 [Volvox africanus]